MNPDTLHRQARVDARRRLDAALRAEPLTRDPAISCDACPAPGELVVGVGPITTAWPTGLLLVVVPLLATVGARSRHDVDGWAFSRQVVYDVQAAADHAGRPIRPRSVER